MRVIRQSTTTTTRVVACGRPALGHSGRITRMSIHGRRVESVCARAGGHSHVRIAIGTIGAIGATGMRGPTDSQSRRRLGGSQFTAKFTATTRASSSSSVVSSSSSSVESSREGSTWELDFCSRPILDERGKKVWELLVTDDTGSFTHSRFFPNNKINSTELKNAVSDLVAERGDKPGKILFFRNQMQTIITRALGDLEIEAVPSRRCYRLMSLLEDRLETVYKKDPGYSEKASTLFVYEMGAPEDLPDALRGESWSFVQLPLGALRGELGEVTKGNAFGRVLDIEAAGLGAAVTDETLVPGVAIYSRRAKPLAAWTNGLELAAVAADTDRACLVLETGVNDRWKYGAYRRTQETTEEAYAWEQAKLGVGGLHFLTVMTDEEADDVAGLWLLCDKRPPNV